MGTSADAVSVPDISTETLLGTSERGVEDLDHLASGQHFGVIVNQHRARE